jgi:hypothetical protein
MSKNSSIESRGWFAWMYNHYLVRYPAFDVVLDDLLEESGIKKDYQILKDPQESELLTKRALKGVRQNPWAYGFLAGRDKNIPFLHLLWPHLDPLEKGSFLAGFTEDPHLNKIDETSIDLAFHHFPECEFHPRESVQMLCNAIRFQNPKWIELASKRKWNLDLEIAPLHPFDKKIDDFIMGPPENRHRRGIDLLLNASLHYRNHAGLDFALQGGANPNLPIWRLERSCNENLSALSFAIQQDFRQENKIPTLSRKLLEAGADPRGIDFEGRGHPLFIALEIREDDFAEELLQKGALFEKPDPEKKPARQPYFHISSEDKIRLEEIRREYSQRMTITPREEKQWYDNANAQGGILQTPLILIMDNLDRIKRFHPWGLDTRLSAEEILHALKWKCDESLEWLIGENRSKSKT